MLISRLLIDSNIIEVRHEKEPTVKEAGSLIFIIFHNDGISTGKMIVVNKESFAFIHTTPEEDL